jgi:hypothetical protein
MIERFCDLYRVSRSNPMAAVFHPRRCLPIVQAHRARVRNLMRPTGEASGPVSGDFVCRFRVCRSCSSRRLVIRLAPPPHRAFRLRGSWRCNRHGSIPWQEASRFRGIIQVLFLKFLSPAFSLGRNARHSWHMYYQRARYSRQIRAHPIDRQSRLGKQ